MAHEELDAAVEMERPRGWQGGFTSAIAWVQQEHDHEVWQLRHQNNSLRSKLAELQSQENAMADTDISSNKASHVFNLPLYSVIPESKLREKARSSKCDLAAVESFSQDALTGQDKEASSDKGDEGASHGQVVHDTSCDGVVQPESTGRQSQDSVEGESRSIKGMGSVVSTVTFTGLDSLHEADEAPPKPDYSATRERSLSGSGSRTLQHLAEVMSEGGLRVRDVWLERPQSRESADWSSRDPMVRRKPANSPHFERADSAESTVSMRLSQATGPDAEEPSEDDDEHLDSCFVRTFMMYPTSIQRVMWDMLTMFVLGYDVVTIPLMLAFEIAKDPAFTVASWATATFWASDIIMTLRTGAYIKDKLVMRPSTLAKRYIRSWALYDFAIVSLDWFFIMMSDSSSAARLSRIGKFLRAARFLRMLRLLRVLKAKSAVSQIAEQLLTEVARVRFKATKIIMFLMMLNHLIACLWYSIGSWDSSSSTGSLEPWVAKNDMMQHSTFYRYCVSVQWSISNFGVGSSSQVYPGTLAEHVFAVIVMMIALIVFSTIVSTITNAYSFLQQVQNKEERDFGQLRTFFRQNDIPKELGTRIQRYVQYMQHHNMRRLAFKDLELLHLASDQLKAELQHHTFRGYLLLHKVLRRLCEYSRRMMHKVSSKALKFIFLALGDFIFYRGQVGSQMFFIPQSGDSQTLEYIARQASIKDVLKDRNNSRKQLIRKGCWISEAAIWSSWIHVGSIRIVEEVCEIVALEAVNFASTVSSWPAVHREVCNYAISFVKRLNNDIMNPTDDRTPEEASTDYELIGPDEEMPAPEIAKFPSFKGATPLTRLFASIQGFCTESEKCRSTRISRMFK